MKEMDSRAFVLMVANVASSTAVVLTNKWVFVQYQFRDGIALTAFHFLCTFLGLLALIPLGVFTPQRLPFGKLLLLSLVFCVFVVTSNFSLLTNSMGIFQLSKVLSTPLLLLLSLVLPGPPSLRSPAALLSLALSCAGVALASVTDVSLSSIGAFLAIAGVLSQVLHQLRASSLQIELSADAMQLLFYQAFISFFILCGVSFAEHQSGLFRATVISPLNLPFEAILAILASAVFAFSVNLSTFYVLRLTSPLSYSVLGHLKICLGLVGGTLIFAEPISALRLAGIAMALLGISWYTWVKHSASSSPSPPPQNKPKSA